MVISGGLEVVCAHQAYMAATEVCVFQTYNELCTHGRAAEVVDTKLPQLLTLALTICSLDFRTSKFVTDSVKPSSYNLVAVVYNCKSFNSSYQMTS